MHSKAPDTQQLFLVSPSLPFEVVIGTDVLQRLSIVIDCKQQTIIFPEGQHIKVNQQLLLTSTIQQEQQSIIQNTEQSDNTHETNVIEDLIHDVENIEAEKASAEPTINTFLNAEQQSTLTSIIQENIAVFRPSNGRELCDFPPFVVDTGTASPVRHRQATLAYNDRQIIQDQIDTYLKNGWIKKAASPWGSRVVKVVRNGKVRMCIDLRDVNAVTVPDSFPAPQLRECIDSLAGAKYFTILDADAAYHQCQVEEESAKKLLLLLSELCIDLHRNGKCRRT